MITSTDATTTAAVSHTGTLAEHIAEFSNTLVFDDIPTPVVECATLHALDAIGVALASSGMDFGAVTNRAARRLGDGSASRSLGFGTSLPSSSAALVNGVLIHGLDFDDTHIAAIHHASAPALAAALAIGEECNADGKKVLTAYIVGLEVGCRVAAAGAGRFHDRGFHPTGVAGTFAAACVTGSLRGLSAPAITSSLGLCGSQAAGILEIRESWLKRMHPGWAAHAGIIAATLAEEGFVGPATVFEGEHGLYASHLEQTVDAEALSLNDLGSRWMTTEVAFKPYPCCHFTHAFIDAASDLLRELDVDHLDPVEVLRVVCPTSERLRSVVTEPTARKIAPATIYDALFSVPYAVALTLTRGRVDLAGFYDEALDDPAVLALASKTQCPSDPASDYPRHFPGEVILELRDGRTLHRRVLTSRGTSESPLSAQEVQEKFNRNARRVLPAGDVDTLAAAITDLARCDSINALLLRTQIRSKA